MITLPLSMRMEQNTTTISPTLDPIDGQPVDPYIQYMKQIETVPMGLVQSVTGIFYVLGIAANLLLITYLITFKRYKSPTFALILSLACSDFVTCFGATLMTRFALYTLEGPFWLCGLLGGITVLGYDNSSLHLVFFSIMRFYQLVFPLKARAAVTPRLVSTCCAVLWAFVMVTSVFISTYYKGVAFLYRGNSVRICALFGNQYQLFMETFYELIPTVLIVGFHLAKYCALRVRSGGNVTENQSEKQVRQTTTDTRALVIILVVYCLTAWPQLVHFYAHFVFNLAVHAQHFVFVIICIAMEFGNSVINPFIYVFCAGSVRRDVFMMLRCKLQKQDVT